MQSRLFNESVRIAEKISLIDTSFQLFLAMKLRAFYTLNPLQKGIEICKLIMKVVNT